MRPVRFHVDSLVALLRRERIATIEQLKAALGTSVDMTVFRKLREIPYQTSYSHRGRYYALDELTRFDERGLWTYRDVDFSVPTTSATAIVIPKLTGMPVLRR